MIKILLVALASLSGCFSAAAAADRLSPREIRALFPGSFTGTWQGKHTIAIVAGEDGSLAGAVGSSTDTGVWSISGRQLCVTFKTWTENVKQCGEVFKQGEFYIGFIQDGKPQLQFQKN